MDGKSYTLFHVGVGVAEQVVVYKIHILVRLHASLIYVFVFPHSCQGSYMKGEAVVHNCMAVGM